MLTRGKPRYYLRTVKVSGYFKAKNVNEDLALLPALVMAFPSGYNNIIELHDYQDYESGEKFPIPDEKISLLLPECYQDKIVRVYSKKSELV